MTLYIRDEADIVASNLLYHLNNGVDFVIATDNGSVDGTDEILAAHAREGHLHLLRDPSMTHPQADSVTRMARLAATDFAADWVINCDADEFWWSDHGTLKQALQDVPDHYGILDVPRYDFIPQPEARGAFSERMVVRHVLPVDVAGRSRLEPKAVHRAHADIEVYHGNHRVGGTELVHLRGWSPIQILHFPIRSYTQWERKLSTAQRSPRPRKPAWREGQPIATKRKWAARMLEEGSLGDAYAAVAKSDADIDAGIRAGRLTVDRRVCDFLHRLAAEPSVCESATPPAHAQRADHVERTLDILLSANEYNQREIEALRGKLARLDGKVGQLRKKVEGLQHRVGRLRGKLARDQARRRKVNASSTGWQRAARRLSLRWPRFRR